jgi:DNA-binding beta-propeller fold protein YncE
MKKLGVTAAIVAVLLGASWLLFHKTIKRMLRAHKEPSTGRFEDPEGLAVDAEGNIYVSDEDRGVFTVLSPTGQSLLTFKDARIHGDSLVAHSRSSLVIIGEHELWELDVSGAAPKFGKQISCRGSGPDEFEDPEGTPRIRPTATCTSQTSNHRRIHASFDKNGKWLRHLNLAEDPESVTVAPDGRLVVTFSKADLVQVFAKDGTPGPVIGRSGKGPGQFRNPDYVRFGPDGNLYVTDQKNARIQVFDKDLKFVRFIGRPGSGPGEFDDPEDIGFDPQGRLVVADGGNHRIQVLKPTGEFVAEYK